LQQFLCSWQPLVANAVYVSVLVSQNMLYEPTPVIILYSKVIISVWSVVPFYC